MKVQIDAPKDTYIECMKSISDVISGEGNDIPLELNLIANSDNEVLLYVRRFNNLQILHRLVPSEGISINVVKEDGFVFSSQVLASLVRKASADRLTLTFREHKFSVKAGDKNFSRPLAFDLRLYQQSEFQEPMDLREFYEIATINRQSVIDGLRMMKEISPEVSFVTEDGELHIHVQDAVQGEGKMVVDLDDDSSIQVDRSFEIRPIVAFLKNLRSSETKVKFSEEGHLMLSSCSESMESQLVLSHRL
jgi:hypothetical protein